MDVKWILSKLIDYDKFNKWLEEAVWINYVRKWVYGSIFSVYVKKINID